MKKANPASVLGKSWPRCLLVAGATTVTAAYSQVLTPAQIEQLRNAMLLDAPETVKTFYPSLGAGVPSAFGSAWGDISASMTYAGKDNLRPEADGSISASIGLGNPRDQVGLELNANMLSIRRTGENWNFDAKLHKMVYEGTEGYVAVALGRNNFQCSGSNACSRIPGANGLAPRDGSNYIAISGLTRIKGLGSSPVPMKMNLGLGDGYFSSGNKRKYSLFGDVGIQAHPRLGLSFGYSGVGFNAGVSYIPLPKLPLTINVLAADLASNTPAGTNYILSLSWNTNFLK